MTMRLREPWLVAIAAAFAALLLTRADFVPLFDGRIYANCIVDAALAHLSPFNLQCAGHPDYAFMLFMSVPQLLAPSSFIPMLLAGVALGVLAIGAFYATLAALFPGASHRVERLLLTAALAFNPVVVVSFLNPNPDNAVLAFFLLATWASVAGREVALILSGLVLCFCKESGALLYALLLALHVVSNASRIDGGPADKLRALRPAIRLSLPLVVFAAVLTARTVFAQRVLWQGEGVGPVVAQLLSFRIDDPVFHAYLAGAFLMHFHWLPTLLVGAYLARTFVWWILRAPAGDEPLQARATSFAILYFVGTSYLLTRYRTFADPRYWMAVYPASLAVLLPAAQWALRGRRVRRTALGGFAVLLGLSNFATIDPVTRWAFGTFDFGSHPMLAMTSISHECCGFGRDQLVYNLQATELNELVDRAFERIRPTDATEIAVAPRGNWYILGPLDPTTFRRTLKRTGVVRPAYHETTVLVDRAELPADLYFIALPNVDNQASLEWLRQRYARNDRWRVEHDGYAMDVVHATMPVGAPP
jgi:hypothetical protein